VLEIRSRIVAKNGVQYEVYRKLVESPNEIQSVGLRKCPHVLQLFLRRKRQHSYKRFSERGRQHGRKTAGNEYGTKKLRPGRPILYASEYC